MPCLQAAIADLSKDDRLMPDAARTHLSTMRRMRRIRPAGEAKRLSPSNRGYGRGWQRFRKWYLRHNPLCNVCEGAATEVDHIVPLSQGGAHCDEDNSVGYCKPCHSRKTGRETMRLRRVSDDDNT